MLRRAHSNLLALRPAAARLLSLIGWRATRHPPRKDLNSPGEVGFTLSVHKSRVRSDGELRIRPFQDLPQRREVVLCRMRDANRVESPIPLAIPCLTAAT